MMKKALLALFVLVFTLVSCEYPKPILTEDMTEAAKDSLRYLSEYHFTLDTNLEVIADSINLACLPLQDCRNMVYEGDLVVVAEFAIDSLMPRDSILVKLAHSQEVQGWVYLKDIRPNFLPVNDISNAIHVFADTHFSYFLIILALFIIVLIIQAFRKQKLQLIYFNDIGSTYPLFLCLLMAFSATLYESIRHFYPETWEHFYYNPTLSPLEVPFVLSVLLICFWLFLVALIAALTEAFRLPNADAAIFYILGLASALVLCYLIFIYGTRYYVGYAFLAGFIFLFLRRTYQLMKSTTYRRGKCGHPLREKGRCPHCGAINN